MNLVAFRGDISYLHSTPFPRNRARVFSPFYIIPSSPSVRPSVRPLTDQHVFLYTFVTFVAIPLCSAFRQIGNTLWSLSLRVTVAFTCRIIDEVPLLALFLKTTLMLMLHYGIMLLFSFLRRSLVNTHTQQI
jgi:hypothetical protein